MHITNILTNFKSKAKMSEVLISILNTVVFFRHFSDIKYVQERQNKKWFSILELVLEFL